MCSLCWCLVGREAWCTCVRCFGVLWDVRLGVRVFVVFVSREAWCTCVRCVGVS